MKLYLSSYRIPDSQALFSLIGQQDNIRAAIIPNAKDYYAKRARGVKLKEATDYLQNLGIDSEIVDLAESSKPEDLQQVLQKFNFIWIIGGNTFCLRYEMKRSGFDQIINDLLENGLIYVGESAGSCVAGTTLKGLETADNPEFAEEIIYEGLGLLPNIISPHVGNPMFTNDIEHVRELYKNDSSLVELTDYQVLVVNNGKQEIITKALE